MHIKRIRKHISAGKAILSSEVESKHFNKTQIVYFAYPEQYLTYLPDNADPFLPAVLIPAMIYGEDFIVDAPISRKFLVNQSLIQDIFCTWYPENFKKIHIIASKIVEDKPEASKRNATFFSLGVDSMFTMLKYLRSNNPPSGKELSGLIYMKGLEIPLSKYRNKSDDFGIKSIIDVAIHYNLDVIIGETNIRDVFPIDWETRYSGPCLASVALSLSNGFDHIYIPSSHSYCNLSANPSSPLTDGLWSNGQVKIVHDGAEAERAEKIEGFIAKDDFTLNKLRVCIDNEGHDSNCGKCWKCVSTMVTLKIINKLGSSKSFPVSLPPNFGELLKTYNKSSLIFTQENQKLAQKYNDSQLVKALRSEIRMGKLDLVRDKKPAYFLLKEMLFYYWWKVLKRLGVS